MIHNLKEKVNGKIITTVFKVKRKLMLEEFEQNNKGMGVVEVILIILDNLCTSSTYILS